MKLFSFTSLGLALVSGQGSVGAAPGMGLFTHPPAHLVGQDVVPEGACPPEFELRIVGNKHECRKVHTAPHDRSCPPGFTLSHDNCFKKIIQEPHIKCPPGLEREGNVCLDQKVEDPAVSCPKGFVLKNGNCVPKIMSAPRILTCPEGFFLDDGKCFKTIEVPTILECPPGLELEDGMCTDIETTIVITTCPAGFLRIPVAAETVLCLRVEKAQPTFGCPKGAVLTPDNKCRVHKRPQKGFCVKPNNGDQNAGVIKIDSLDGNSQRRGMDCYQKCADHPMDDAKKTGCELIWDQGNRGCYLHTQEVSHGNGRPRHACWIFHQQQCVWEVQRNRYIPGHNHISMDGSVEECQAACAAWEECKSFDYHNGENKCDLSKSGPADVALRASGDYTNYECSDRHVHSL